LRKILRLKSGLIARAGDAAPYGMKNKKTKATAKALNAKVAKIQRKGHEGKRSGKRVKVAAS